MTVAVVVPVFETVMSLITGSVLVASELDAAAVVNVMLEDVAVPLLSLEETKKSYSVDGVKPNNVCECDVTPPRSPGVVEAP